MARYPLLDRSDIVRNVCEMVIADVEKWTPPTGLHVGEPSNTANIGDRWDGNAYVPNDEPAAPRAAFLARDLTSLWTPEDMAAINGAAANSPQIGLWLAMLYSRGEKPIETTGETFNQAWGALVAVLGQQRSDELRAQLLGG